MSDSDQDAMLACINGNAYYLASAGNHDSTDGFGTPTGYQALGSQLVGGLWSAGSRPRVNSNHLHIQKPRSLTDNLSRAVNTYVANNGQNGGSTADPTIPGTYASLSQGDITTPGFIRIPVCSVDTATNAVNAKDTSDPLYPCSIPPSPNECGTSAFENETSDASPLVSDCQQIILNIQGTNRKWSPENVNKNTNTIVSYGTCNFDVQSYDLGNGSVDYYVGAQDIIDLINSSIAMYASNGKVGSKGTMTCNGDTIASVSVTWGIY
jgi:hypothetical protein